MKKIFCSITFIMIIASGAFAAEWFVDSAATGSNNGTTWANAWTSFSSITGLAAGDTVYISGGSSGSSKSYSGASITPTAGAAGNPITYSVGLTAGHNGLVRFSSTGSNFVDKNHIIVSGYAGDSTQHIEFIGSKSSGIISTTNAKISYVKSVGSNGRFFYGSGLSNVEIDHCYINKLPTTANADHVFYLQGSWSNPDAYGSVLVHDNTIYFPYQLNGNGIGEDCFKAGGKGVSVYNNYAKGIPYTSTIQHMDGLQSLGAYYLSVYNNTFVDVTNYSIFLQAQRDYTFNHVKIYNNIAYKSSASVIATNYQGISLGTNSTGTTWNDIIIANNLIADNPGERCIAFSNTSGSPTNTFTNNYVYNNVCVNNGYTSVQTAVATEVDSLFLTTTQAATYFTTYSQYGGDANNFRPTVNATGIINQGTNAASYFTLDKDGNSRGTTWDIGPYEYGGTPPTPPSDTTPPVITIVSPTAGQSLACTSDPVNVEEVISTNEVATAKYGSSNVVYASLPSVFSTQDNLTHTRTVSRACGATYTTYVAAQDTASPANTSATTSMSYTISAASPPATDYNEAEDGTIVSPMVVASNSAASGGHYIHTTVSGQGTANYTFSVAQTGTYRIQTRVYLQSASADSFYFSIDGADEDTWDGNPSSLPEYYGAWVTTYLNKRGTGTFSAPQYSPYEIYLTSGNHTLAIRGREPNTFFDWFEPELIAASEPPPPVAPNAPKVSLKAGGRKVVAK